MMPETQTYTFEPERHRVHAYEIHTGGLTYRPPGRKPIDVHWEDIRYLTDIAGLRVEIVCRDPTPTIPLFYATPDFTALLTAVCTRLAALRREQLGVQTFQGQQAYTIHRTVVLALFTFLIAGSSAYIQRFTMPWYFICAMTLPMMFYILRLPHTVMPGKDNLVVKSWVATRCIDYGRIARVAFGFHGDRRTACLCVLVHLTDGRRIKIQRFENLILLYICIWNEWQMHQAKAPGPYAQP